MNTAQKDNGLFDGGPPLAWQKSIHLIRSSSDRGTPRRSAAAILLGWIPVAILALIDVGRGNTTASSFFADVAMHARFLIAVPMLLLAEADSIPLTDKAMQDNGTSYTSHVLFSQSYVQDHNKEMN